MQHFKPDTSAKAQQAALFGIVGRSGSGKTTLITALLHHFGASGLRVNVIKHSHHDLELEPPHKDSARFRAAGAAEVLVSSPYRFALVHELRHEAEPSLAEQLARLAPADLTLVEGYQAADIPRLEVFRPATGLAPLYATDTRLCAVACDEPLDLAFPCLPLNNPAAIAAFIGEKCALHVNA